MEHAYTKHYWQKSNGYDKCHTHEPATQQTIAPRLQYIDLAKGICILLVVWFHLGVRSNMDVYFDNIRMPLYFFISGFFFKRYNNIQVFIKKKANKLLIPFLFFYLTTSFLLPLIMHHISGIEFSTGSDWTLLYAFLTYNDYPNIPLWFLWGLFILNITFYCLHENSKKDLILGITCLALQIILGNILTLPASLNNAFKGLFFFYIGYMVHKNDLQKFPCNSAMSLLILLTFIALGQALNHTSNEVYRILMQIPASLLGITLLMNICKRINHLPYISYVGRYSIILLVTHEPIIKVLYTLHINNTYIMYAIILLSYIVIIPTMRKYLPYVTAQKDILNYEKRTAA